MKNWNERTENNEENNLVWSIASKLWDEKEAAWENFDAKLAVAAEHALAELKGEVLAYPLKNA